MPRNRFEEAWQALVFAAVFLAMLATAIFWLYGTFTHTAVEQRNIRRAEIERAALLRLQLDEETGLRGYLATHRDTFLAPYRNAVAQLPNALAVAEASMRSLNLPVDSLVHQRQINQLWLASVARPSLAGHTSTQLQLNGKLLIDRFRAQNDVMRAMLDRLATDVDRAGERTLRRIIAILGLVALFVCLLLYMYTLRQARLSSALRAQRLAYENEKQIADGLQRAFLQVHLPQPVNLGLHAMYVPAGTRGRVGGDWYDAFQLPDGRIVFSIGDVAGHGLEAAVTMSRVRQGLLSTSVNEDDPAVVLARTSDVLMLQDDKMVTAICGYIDPVSFRIRYATAGHPPPILVSDATARFLSYDGIPLGAFPSPDYRPFELTAPPDSLLVLYTDGVIEHKRNILESEQRLLRAAANAASDKRQNPAIAIHRRMFGSESAVDDVAILTIGFGRPSGRNDVTVQGLQTAST